VSYVLFFLPFFLFLCALYCCIATFWVNKDVYKCGRCACLSVSLSVYVCGLDVDECSEDSDPCKPLGTCHNVPGGYQCTCPRGYEPDASGKSCQDMDECSDEQTCQYGCINLPGGYRCECPIGFVQHLYWNQCIGQYTLDHQRSFSTAELIHQIFVDTNNALIDCDVCTQHTRSIK